MRTNVRGQPIAEITEVKVEQGQLLLRRTCALSCPVPQQDQRLPEKLEQAVEAGRQEIKRRLFQQALVHAELELLPARRQGAHGLGFQRRGRKRYAFKAVFGTGTMRRQQIKLKPTGAWCCRVRSRRPPRPRERSGHAADQSVLTRCWRRSSGHAALPRKRLDGAIASKAALPPRQGSVVSHARTHTPPGPQPLADKELRTMEIPCLTRA
jgi:hypothetical protein